MGQISSSTYDVRRRKGRPTPVITIPARKRRAASSEILNSKFIRTSQEHESEPRDSTTKITECYFDRLPAELCRTIFEFILIESWNGTTPVLIKALRPHERLYSECMYVWHQQKHTYTLHAKNNWSFLDMSKEAISTTTDVVIIIDENIALHPLLRWSDLKVTKKRFSMSVHDLNITGARATAVTSVTLDCRPTTENLYYWYPSKFSLFFSGFKRLKYAATTCPEQPHLAFHPDPRIKVAFVDPDSQERSMERGIKEANEILAVVARYDRVYADIYDHGGRRAHRKCEDREKWVWVAEEGKFLGEVDIPPGLRMDRFQ
ncbi:hypothetical protein ONS95_008120 [Cadophora gregata]|uniref:uncharacterized protein n=1 Tax=Cadophora gregata TaxID=51156 RepID=UPI0026DD72A0|nr:uncharacterized protein ONS95_008120 [Cadophora gregata]KAK0119271.1 hypothetical protein ONS96_012330 [Cadophora gregata f. sp. sojae]KAK0126525.1 hypothetical protein ONS95_008120 [Cadophora gregata]